MEITLVTVGKIKERCSEDVIEGYSEHLSRYYKLKIVQVADKKTSDRTGEALEKQIREKEGQKTLSNIKDGIYVIALTIESRILSSEELALELQKMGVDDTNQIAFVVSGSLGLSEAVMEWADYVLSFSKMIFPHRPMRAVLLEQIYRSYRIIGGGPYHK